MATESIGKTVYMDDDFADRFIAAQERVNKNPPPSRKSKIKWGDSEDLARRIHAAYGDKNK